MKQTKSAGRSRRCLTWIARAAGVLLGAGLLFAVAQNTYAAEREPNNDISQANVINVNSPVTGQLEKSNDVDVYMFTLTEAGEVSISLSYPYIDKSLTYWEATLLNTNNESLRKVGFVGNAVATLGTVTSKKTGLDAGTYYVRIGKNIYSDANYTLVVNFSPSQNWEKERNETIVTPTIIPVNTNINGSLSNSNDKDYYQFTIPANGVVSLTYSHGYIDKSLVYWVASFVDSNEKELKKINFYGNEANSITAGNIGLAAGTYYLCIKDNIYSSEEYQFCINYERSESWEREFNDTIIESNEINIGSDVKGSIQSSSDKDYYSFTLPTSAMVTIAFTHQFIDKSLVYWILSVRDNNDKEVMRDSYKGNDVSHVNSKSVFLDAGAYHIKIEKNIFDDSTYTFRVNTGTTNSETNNSTNTGNTNNNDANINTNVETGTNTGTNTNTGSNTNSNTNTNIDTDTTPYIPTAPTTPSPGRVVSDWARAEVDRADAMNLIPASISNVDLRQPINRGEFAAVAVKVYESLAATSAIPSVVNPFTDTADPDILRAYNIGTVNGMTATTYQPFTLLNREQCATMLTRVFKRVTIPGWTLNADAQFRLAFATPSTFADDALISDYARESVYFMAANGIINGMGNNVFAPRNITSADEANHYANATREQAIAIALRMVENLRR